MKEMKVEVLSTAELDADAAAKAKRRMDRCVMSGAEQELYVYNPEAARQNKNPGYPDEEYGEV